ncbi:hypothetical protein MIND_00082400 [Mycena indigotica]|uniref:Uncharacterized protein n=1 Tax=Mycena indigotica TaxID=2126181 RepID=A0A8H6TDG3_9AGAR|nr:uncharacterized protein MIND_00082400 [Mycena indigotica]KAF7315668.1 hypothetical protein MIND_00082400 [Mycena indigotica]
MFATPIQLLYTFPFSPTARILLERTLSTQGLDFAGLYDPAFDGLSPSDLFRRRDLTFGHNFALVADERTLKELDSHLPPTLSVLSVRSRTPIDEWGDYTGPDLNPLSWSVRLALLRSMVKERLTLDSKEHPDSDSFWENPKPPHRYDEKIYQIKWLRANISGAIQACQAYADADNQYPAKDKNALYTEFKLQADKTGGVFIGLQL